MATRCRLCGPMPDRVTQILTNLISNAHKYTLVEGSITVAARPDDGFVRVDVSDTGIGLSPEDQAQLFTKFFRAHDRSPQAGGGTGLGLVITRLLVELHGGRITVSQRSRPGLYFQLLPARAGGPGMKCPQCEFEIRDHMAKFSCEVCRLAR